MMNFVSSIYDVHLKRSLLSYDGLRYNKFVSISSNETYLRYMIFRSKIEGGYTQTDIISNGFWMYQNFCDIQL